MGEHASASFSTWKEEGAKEQEGKKCRASVPLARAAWGRVRFGAGRRFKCGKGGEREGGETLLRNRPDAN